MNDLGGLPVIRDAQRLMSVSVDRWPRAVKMAQLADLPRFGGVVCPRTSEDVSAVVRDAAQREVHLVPVGLRSGVCGATTPWSDGEIAVDMTGLDTFELDKLSLTARIGAGMRGDELERRLGEHQLTLGHYPQSLHLSTVGGWLSTRASGTASTRYGSIEHRVQGLTVVLPDGLVVRTPTWPRASVGPDLSQLFIGAEGTLGIICDATLAVRRVAESRIFESWSFDDFEEGLAAMRTVMQAGIAPAVARLYNAAEANRFTEQHVSSLLLLVHEGPEALVVTERRIVDEILSGAGGQLLSGNAAAAWWHTRFDASSLFDYAARPGGIADAIELTADWRVAGLAECLESELQPLCTAVHMHASHFYTSGASIYLIIYLDADGPQAVLDLYDTVWRRIMELTLAFGGAISHHHGIGRQRLPWFGAALGSASVLIDRVKMALDPTGVLCPGRLDIAFASDR